MRHVTSLESAFSAGDGLLDIRSPVDGTIVARVVRPLWSQVDEALERPYRRGRWEAI